MDTKIPYRINNINIDNICYTDIKSNKTKTIIYIKYNDKDRLKNLVFQSPSLLNINDVVNKNNINELDIPLYGKCDSKVQVLIDFFNNLDRKILTDAKRNTKWFDNFIKSNTIKYQSIIRDCNESKYSNGMIRMKILKSDDFETLLQMNNKDKISIDKIQKNSWVKMILEIYAIWVNENGFGLFIRPILMSFKLKNQLEYNYKLIDDSDEIDDVIHTVNDNDNSIFIKAETDLVTDNNATSTVLEMPNDNSFMEIHTDSSNMSDAKCNNSLSSTSST